MVATGDVDLESERGRLIHHTVSFLFLFFLTYTLFIKKIIMQVKERESTLSCLSMQHRNVITNIKTTLCILLGATKIPWPLSYPFHLVSNDLAVTSIPE